MGLSLAPALASAEDAPRQYPACDRTPTQGDVSAAKGAFDAGNGSFNEADYDRAITYWEDAYRRDCTAHPLLLNLARAYELNGLKQHAVVALQTFLARVPNSSEESQIKRRIEKLQEQIQSEAQTAPPPAATTATTTTEPPPVSTTTAAAEQPPPPSSGHRPITPLIVGGAGVVLTVVSGIIWIGANSDIKDFEVKCPGRQCSAENDSARASGNAAITRRDVSGALALVGIAAILGGGIWYGVSKPTQSASTTPHGFTATVTPAFAPGYGGMAVAGAF
jgi:tetratricopeptide (TPR) repeat protein